MGTTFMLIHGAWRGGWIYKRLAHQLRARGHEAYTPSLTGCGEHRRLLNGDITLSTHITDVVDLIEFEQLTDVVLVGHSYAGMVITGVADAVPEHVQRLVYVDAAVPKDGQSFVDVYPAERDAFAAAAAGNRGLYIDPPPANFFGVNATDQELVDRFGTPFPHAALTEKLSLRGSDLTAISRSYVLAEGWAANPYVDNKPRLADDPTWDFHTINVGHDIMLDAPEFLLDVLLT